MDIQKECEKILRNFSKKNESQVAILRLPNILESGQTQLQ